MWRRKHEILLSHNCTLSVNTNFFKLDAKQVRKTHQRLACHPVSKARTNKFYICRQWMDIVYLSQQQSKKINVILLHFGRCIEMTNYSRGMLHVDLMTVIWELGHSEFVSDLFYGNYLDALVFWAYIMHIYQYKTNNNFKHILFSITRTQIYSGITCSCMIYNSHGIDHLHMSDFDSKIIRYYEDISL